MPRGDTGQGNPHLGAYGVALAIVLCTIIAGILSYSSGRESERRNHAPASYSSAAKQDAQRACVGMKPATAFECIYEKIEASQEQARGEQDLSAQQRAASAAMISAFIALLTLGATGLGVWYVKRTLDATLEAVKDTSKATVAMNEANEIAKDTARWGQRPMFVLDRLHEAGQQGDFGPLYSAAWRNIGSGPGLITKFSFSRAYANVNQIDDYIRDLKASPAIRRGEKSFLCLPNALVDMWSFFSDHVLLVKDRALRDRKSLTPGEYHGFDPTGNHGPYDMAIFFARVEYQSPFETERTYWSEAVVSVSVDPLKPMRAYEWRLVPDHTRMS
jgi:hypothetical protein